MSNRFTPSRRRTAAARAAALLLLAGGVACSDQPLQPKQTTDQSAPSGDGPEYLFPVGDVVSKFDGLALGYSCTVPGGDPDQPLILPKKYEQTIIAREPQMAGNPDMQTLNETGPHKGRYLYRTHEVGSNGSLSVTDLVTGVTKTAIQRADWESLDGIAWTPWGTIVFAEETGEQSLPDPQYPDAVGGLVYEYNPETNAVRALPAVGAKSHEGLRFDGNGNLYSISETSPGFIFKFVPDFHGDLSAGQLFALKVVDPDGDRTGRALWIPLDRRAVAIDANAAAAAAGATGYGRPEDVETGTSTGMSPGGNNVMYVSVTNESRVLAIDLKGRDGVRVYQYVKAGVNAPADFQWPDNVALDKSGNLYITEDPGGSFEDGKRRGDNVWQAEPSSDGLSQSPSVKRFLSLTDCDAEPTGIYLSPKSDIFFVDVQHRGGDGVDYSVAVTKPKKG
jgi:uncharacterized protein